MGSDRFRRSEGDSRFEWVLTGSGFPRFANRFRELVPGFDRFRGSESGNAVRRGRVKHPCCWGYHLRFFFWYFCCDMMTKTTITWRSGVLYILWPSLKFQACR